MKEVQLILLFEISDSEESNKIRQRIHKVGKNKSSCLIKIKLNLFKLN